ncbi:MAG: SAM-dependent methyltransferase [uncultured Nocardioidaceae bacterium]|uniref:SAM-dependent methyltransferase n=1 Tax=uncultured Nocardioidaceae bacterium TaxID=253824 RepID=A0A6J4MM38_9ACTN|nr:MAG: SAM-dependent methyltransferase [uncultured Nocardioidaceae bacterium]
MDARDWDQRYAASEQVWSLGPNPFVAAELADLTPGAALDLACGEGRNAIWLAGRGWQVTAVDFSQVAVDRGRRTAGDLPISWQVGNALTVELPSVDLAVLAYLQLSPDERRTAVRRAFGVLRPGGTLFVVAHDSSNLTEGTGGPQDPTVLYTAEDVLADLAGGDLVVVRAERARRVVTAADEHGGATDSTAWDAVVRLIRR